MKYTLSYTETFENELNEAFVYISEKLYNITAAERLIKNTLTSLSNLTEFPFSCPVCDGKLGKVGYRKLLVGNYIVLYYVNGTRQIPPHFPNSICYDKIIVINQQRSDSK